MFVSQKKVYMKKIFKRILLLFVVLLLPIVSVAMPDQSGVASVNVTSDTAANAKVMAFAEARRQIIIDVLSKYSDPVKFNELMKDISNDDLMNLISSTSIEGEKLSATTYSANIKMNVDMDAAKKWLLENDIQNWLDTEENKVVDKLDVIVEIPKGLSDWIDFNHAIVNKKVDFWVKNISGDQVTIEIPLNSRASFLGIVRESDWRYSGTSSVRIWR